MKIALPMSGEDLRACRKHLGMNAITFGAALGYSGDDESIGVQIRRYEAGRRPIPSWIERLALMYALHGAPAEILLKRKEWLESL